MKGFVASVFFIMAMATSAVAQYYHTPFGHNRIQYKRFDWYFYSTSNFEVYYYPGGQEYALEALSFLEDEFIKLTDILGYAPYTKTKIFIYNSMQELQQSNIGIGGDVFTIGGKTDFVKLQVEIAYPGQAATFKKELVNNLSRILIQDMMFGGSLAEIFQNSYLLSLPDWFIGGASQYLAYGWSQEMDDYIRDYLARKKIKKLVKIQNEEAEIIGQSIWNYIALKYGRTNISNILNLTRIIRNEENSISSTLGISFRQFLSDWQNYYLRQKEEISEHYIAPEEENIVAGYRSKDVVINQVSINYQGDKVAYAFHKNGKYKVNVVDLQTGKEQTVLSGGYLINEQKIDYHLPLVDWQDNHTIGALLYKRGFLYLNTYNLRTGEKFQKPLERFRHVESFSFNDNGKLAIISGNVDGNNDLFLISMRRNAVKRITNDLYDDLDPVFIPGTAAIVFSSNRLEDSVDVSENVKLKAVEDKFNLFLYDLDTTTWEFQRLTNTYSVDRNPLAKNQYQIYYLSDQKGISNLYRYNMLDSTFIQISNYQYSITDYDLAFGDNKISYLMLDEGRAKLFVEDEYNLNRRLFTPQTARQRLEQAKYVLSRLPQPKPIVEMPLDPLDETISPEDSLILPDSFLFTEDEEPVGGEGELIDTDNYIFEDDVKPAFRPESFFSSYRKLERKSKVLGPLPYEPRFSFNNLITSFAIDPLRSHYDKGFSILLETEINDLLENHRLTGGVLTTTDLKNGNIYGEYQYLKYWMDFRVRFDRNNYVLRNLEERDIIHKYTLNRIEVGAALPLTNTFRFEFSPFMATTNFSNLQNQYIINSNPTIYAPDSRVLYGGLRGAAVLDNTIERGFNLYQGTRALVEHESYFGIGKRERNFMKLNVDLRHYQKIHKELTLAGRLFYGRSMGNNKQNYLLGGMQNWIFSNFEEQGVNDPLTLSNRKNNSNILFTEFVTNLRGYDYNELFGSNALLFNAELRFPVFRYFSNAPIASTFLRNFQLIGFYDIGSAWTGKPPFTRENSAFHKQYKTEGLQWSAEIANFQNPWLVGYGFGLRTVLLGYYLKIDVARPVQDGKIGDLRFYLTLGLDF